MHAFLEILVVTALHAEARPFIDHFKLKKEIAQTAFETFRGEGLSLIVTGIGKVKSAIATASLLCGQPAVPMVAVNVGIAGAHRSSGFNIGELCLIHRIRDAASGREFFPDMLIQTDLREATLSTFDKPVAETDGVAPIDGLVDMEGAGFFEAAAAFLPPHGIGCLKIVSDHLWVNPLKTNAVIDLVARQVPTVEAFLNAMAAMGDMTPSLFGEAEEAWMAALTEALRLTVSQERQLRDWVAGYLACGQATLPDLPPSLFEAPKSKRERSSKLASLRSRLVGER